MYILFADLNKDRSRVSQQITRYSESIAQIGQVRVNSIAPRVAEGFDLLRLAGDVLNIFFDVATSGTPLKVAVEFDAIRRIKVDALHLAAQALALGQAGHH